MEGKEGDQPKYPGEELLDKVEAIESRTENIEGQVREVYVMLQGITGLDGIEKGLAEVAAVLAPLQNLVPPVVAEPLPPETVAAIGEIEAALERPRERVARLPGDAQDIPFIGQPRPPVQRPGRRRPTTALTAAPTNPGRTP